MAKKRLGNFLLVLTGNCLLAAAVAFLIIPNDLLTGGVAGVSVALYPLLHVPILVMVNVLTFGLYIVGALCLGRKFAMNSLLSTLFYPMFTNLFSWIAGQYFPSGYFVMESWIASIYSGFLAGAGLGLCFRASASTGGMDIPALILAKFTPVPEGNAVMLVDGCTVILGIASYGLEPALIGLISVFVSGYIINRVLMLGAQSSQNVLIISDKWADIRPMILSDFNRGVTLLDAKGGYTDDKRPVLMCVISTKEYPALESKVLKLDADAFIIVSDVHSVHGEGFEAGHGTI